MLNVNVLINHFRSNPNHIVYIVDELWFDFHNNISDKLGVVIIGDPRKFMKAVNSTIKHMDSIYNAFRDSNANLIWLNLFNRIRTIAMSYYLFIIDVKFLDLEFRYSKVKTIINTNNNNEVLTFMNLRPNFTRDELLKSYRMLALKYHPDKSGDVEMFRKLTTYKDLLEKFAK